MNELPLPYNIPYNKKITGPGLRTMCFLSIKHAVANKWKHTN